jgi:predicted Zn-dependent protease
VKIALGLLLAVGLSSQDRETALGDLLAKEIRRQSKPVEGDIQEYVRSVAARVAPESKALVETLVRESDSLYDAFASWAPGHVFVSVKILSLARNEAELAGVLAHAMAHHPQRSDSGIIFAGEGINPGEEIRADAEAVKRLAAAGYSPHAYLDYIERAPRILPKRIAALKDAVNAIPVREWIENTSAFVEARSKARAFEPPKLPRHRPSLQEKNR